MDQQITSGLLLLIEAYIENSIIEIDLHVEKYL